MQKDSIEPPKTNPYKLKLIRKYVDKPDMLFQNMIFANYNSLDQVFNEKRNAHLRHYPKYFLPRVGHMSVLILSLYMYMAYFLVLSSYVISMDSTEQVIICAVCCMLVNLLVGFYYNATLVKYMVMPYFYSFNSKPCNDPNVSLLSLN